MARIRVFEIPPRPGALRELLNVAEVLSIQVAPGAPGQFIVILNSSGSASFNVGTFTTLDAANAEAEVWRARIDDAP